MLYIQERTILKIVFRDSSIRIQDQFVRLTQSKIANFTSDGIIFFSVHQNVTSSQITMYNVSFMQIRHASTNVQKYSRFTTIGQFTFFSSLSSGFCLSFLTESSFVYFFRFLYSILLYHLTFKPFIKKYLFLIRLRS